MYYPAGKRLLDIIVSASALLILLPLLILIACLVRLESEGAPLFRSIRIGKYGKPFHILKFRSMVNNAAAMGSWQTSENDPRITRFGKFLRTTSIDELPQLWNVFTGDMSLIGPRPQAPQQQALYTPQDWDMRHRVRPGITGLAQVNGRSTITQENLTAYDNQYATAPNWKLDKEILLKTISLVLRRVGTN